MTQQDLFTIWAEEGQEAMKAKKKGIILDLWKVVAERKVSLSKKLKETRLISMKATILNKKFSQSTLCFLLLSGLCRTL